MKIKTRKIKVTLIVLAVLLLVSALFVGVFLPTNYNDDQARIQIVGIISNQVAIFGNQKHFLSSYELELDKRQPNNYLFEMITDEKSFKVWATPKQYGRNGKISYFFDSKDGNLYGADHNGEKANGNDPLIIQIPEQQKKILNKN
jgi:hypothetical protein